ncbi:CCA tRNA nucleotidyltransferase [Helicobacter sp. 11S03491-1]|uniref:CCA tRNA nucleotidyltransferase n=1 Tax=Helicobacter sp. 11S03491-1 TaxID=1476196 RepID=UPI000BA5B0C6|nr:CCA tRNA nucleotidyltransferase [Helicobacter sp. 11S03491-1]PAF43341.1 hypothetical protein BKH45_01495 [Helicobacter sp. 11S03491-1]
MFEIVLPKQVAHLIAILENNGFEAYVVGGCVRDSLLRENFLNFSDIFPKDWDIATSGMPQALMNILKASGILAIPTGIRHGTISAVIEGKTYEITTYRTENEYEHHRRPKKVGFVQNIQEDLFRRDFTINAMAYHPIRGLVDVCGGREDLENKIIRAVGNANERFEEDALRILRALRLASGIGFEIFCQTKEAIFSHKKLLKFISKERLKKEIEEFICGQYVRGVWEEYAEIIAFVLDDEGEFFNQTRILQKSKETLKIIEYCPRNPTIRMTALFCGMKDPFKTAQKILKNLKYDNKNTKTILKLIKYTSIPLCDEKQWIKKYLRLLGKEDFKMFLDLQYAKAKAFDPQEDNQEELEKLQSIFEKLQEILQKEEAFMLKDLMINGHDLQALGVQKGKEIHNILEAILDAIIHEDIPNTQETIIEFVKKNFL